MLGGIESPSWNLFEQRLDGHLMRMLEEIPFRSGRWETSESLITSGLQKRRQLLDSVHETSVEAVPACKTVDKLRPRDAVHGS